MPFKANIPRITTGDISFKLKLKIKPVATDCHTKIHDSRAAIHKVQLKKVNMQILFILCLLYTILLYTFA
jgi:hypothetical protein